MSARSRLDPYLAPYQIAEHVFYIGGALAPFSIRDQLTRSTHCVDRLCAAGIITPQRELLVIGGGAAGVAATIRAAQRHVRVTLVEREPHFFGRQSSGLERWISPTLYDWPQGHWVETTWLTHPERAPLAYTEGQAAIIHAGWLEQIDSLSPEVRSRITDRRGHEGRRLIPAGDFVWLQLPPGSGTMGPFGAVLLAMGPGEERTALPSIDGQVPRFPAPGFRGRGFWDEQPAVPPGGHVVISGGSDGGIQELLSHATCDPNPRALFSRLRHEAGLRLTPPERTALETAWTLLESTLDREEFVVAQQRALGPSSEEDLTLLIGLDTVYANALAAFLAELTTRSVLASLREAIVPHTRVTLIHSGRHFGWCYPLNRFLAHLLRYLSITDGQVGDTITFRSECRVTMVTSATPGGLGGHICTNCPAECERWQHNIVLRVNASRMMNILLADRVILRHGTIAPEEVMTLPARPPLYQALPARYPFAPP